MTDDRTKPGSDSRRQSLRHQARDRQRKPHHVIDLHDHDEADPDNPPQPPRSPDDGGSTQLTELLVAAGDGDRDAYRRVFQAVYGKVRRIALSVLHDEAHAEDVAQEALLEVWLKAGRFDQNRGSADAWIGMIARRRALDRGRQAHAARLRDTRYRHESVAAGEDDVAEIVMRRLMFVTVQSKLRLLTPLQREALTLAFFSGHTYAAVAQLLGIPAPTAKTRIRDGLERLRAALDEAA